MPAAILFPCIGGHQSVYATQERILRSPRPYAYIFVKPNGGANYLATLQETFEDSRSACSARGRTACAIISGDELNRRLTEEARQEPGRFEPGDVYPLLVIAAGNAEHFVGDCLVTTGVRHAVV